MASRNLKSLEDNSRYFNVDVKPGTEELDGLKHGSDRWFSVKDLEHKDEINKVGLNNRSYNHAKYGKRPPVHQYSFIGHPLQTGMDFSENPKDIYRGPIRKPTIRQNPDWLKTEQNLAAKGLKSHSAPTGSSIVPLPRNIQHQFGTNICNALLSDKELVEQTMANQNASKIVRPSRRQSSVKDVSGDVTVDPTYDALGQSLRQNFFPGHTFGHRVGVIKGDFDDYVHKNRVPETDEYRYQRDELSKYTWAVSREKAPKGLSPCPFLEEVGEGGICLLLFFLYFFSKSQCV